MSPILFLSKLIVRLESLKSLFKGDNKDYSLVQLIVLLFRSSVRLERLLRFAKGDKKSCDPMP